MAKKKSEHYVNNKELLEAMIVYRSKVAKARELFIEKYDTEPPKSGPWEGKPRIPNYLGDCFLKIATHLSYKPNFVNYMFREDMISDGIENCVQYIHNFNPERSQNPFAYFTQIIYFAFLRRIGKEKKQQYVKYKATEQYGILDEFEMMEFEDGTTKQFELYDNISVFIETYETANKKKKEIKKPKGLENFLGE